MALNNDISDNDKQNDVSTQKNSKNIERGIRVEKVDLSSKISEDNKTESELFLPHERDETTGPTGSDSPTDGSSRELIRKAYDDTMNGLKDTDRRGIPSDIVESDIPNKKDKRGIPQYASKSDK
jgi:hypothetical protein